MSEKTYQTKTVLKEGRSQVDIFSVDSTADDSLEAFLIFTGLIGGVPFYYIFCMLILRIASPDLFIGVLFALGLACTGFFIKFFSKKQVIIEENEDGCGTISLKDGIFGKKISYAYTDKAKIKLCAAESKPGQLGETWDVTLIDGRYQYLLDSRCDSLQESKALTDFLAKSMRCSVIFVIEASKIIEVDWRDVNLPYYALVKKYPELQSGHPNRPKNCGIDITDIEGGSGRRYSWKIFDGMASELGILLAGVLILSLLPIFGDPSKRFSIFSSAWSSGSWTFYIAVASVFTVLFMVQAGITNCIEINGERINLYHSFWGIINYGCHSMLLDETEGIVARKNASGSGAVFVSDSNVYSLRMYSPAVAEYIVADIQYFLAVSKINKFSKN